MRIYTRTGDGGETGLVGGERVGKDALRIEACGSVDELNAALGVAVAELNPRRDDDLLRLFAHVQGHLFEIGAELAKSSLRLSAERVAFLEAEIDRLDAVLTPLRTFILPGGCRLGALFHVARTLCRRAERVVVQLHRAEGVSPEVLAYLNRLSDLLFVVARTVNVREGYSETPWKSER